MKNISYIIALFFLLSGCSDMDSLHEEYIKDGEIIYLVKPDSITAMPGKNRMLIEVGYFTATFISQIKVDWEDGRESKIFGVDGSADTIFYDLLIEDLEEKSYQFEIYTIDNEGDRSVKVDEFTAVYGEKYQATLTSIMIDDVNLTSEEATISWASAPDGMSFVQVNYVGMDGSDMKVETSSKETQTIIADLDTSKVMTYRSGYLPTKTALDTFYTELIEIDLSGLSY